MSAVAELPLEWNLRAYFPGVDSTEFRKASSALEQTIAELGRRIEALSDSSGLLGCLERMDDVIEQGNLIGSYLHCLVTTDSKDDAAQAAMSEFDMRVLPFRKLQTKLTAKVGALDCDRPELKKYEHLLNHMKTKARHLMSPAEEELASELAPTSTIAWEKLHSNLTSQIEVDIEGEIVPMSVARTRAYEPERSQRQAAYEAELKAWKKNEVPIAAAINGLKGAVNVLSDKRGWKSPLDAAVFECAMDREVLDAMLEAARESFPHFRRYLQAKARALNLNRLAFHDIFAPLGGSNKTWSYDEAADFVSHHFHGYSQKMGVFADRAFREAWIDVMPKPGKTDGAYCTGMRADESRILMNFKPSFGSVSTLAHELGHGYHNLCLSRHRGLLKDTPMTLAETASIFCETIIRRAVLNGNGPDDEKLTILEASLQGSTQVVVDITSRFLFELSVFEQRRARDLSPTELCDTMRQAQHDTYGEGLDPERLHPYMWAAKPHYYSTESFYNFPYMFGLLFGLGLYSIYEREPNGFHDRYDDLLASTGSADAATLAKRFGIDIRSIDFWRGSLDQIKLDIDLFERLV